MRGLHNALCLGHHREAGGGTPSREMASRVHPPPFHPYTDPSRPRARSRERGEQRRHSSRSSLIPDEVVPTG
jgi:hypothetical protein